MVGVAACSNPGLVLFGGVLYVFGSDGDVDHADHFSVIEGERSGKRKQEHGGDCGLHGADSRGNERHTIHTIAIIAPTTPIPDIAHPSGHIGHQMHP
jgi:hypothetical protein